MKPSFKIALACLAAVCFVPNSTSQAQSPASLTYKAGKVVFTDPGDFTQAQLEEAAGLHVGTVFKAAEVNAAAQRLSDTGYFDTVGAQFEGMLNNVTVTFALKPFGHGQLLHAGFQNFVWLSPEELVAAVRTKVPLFDGYLPEGAQADVAKAALVQALTAKGVNATLQHATVEPTLEHPERVVEFRVATPQIKVGNVKLSGVSTGLVPYVQKSVNDTARTAYNEGRAGVQTTTRILAPLLDAGYADASLANVAVSVGAAASDGSLPVVVSAALSAGEVYKVGKLSFAGTPLVSAESFAATAKLHTGDVASHKQLIETLAPVDAAYRRQGYMDVVASAAPSLDSTAHTVDYAVTVVPGEQYRVHEVQAQGLDAAAKAEFDSGFRMKTGDVYNPEYVTSFLKNNTALRAMTGYSGGFKAYADPSAHTVDVVVTFYKAAAR